MRSRPFALPLQRPSPPPRRASTAAAAVDQQPPPTRYQERDVSFAVGSLFYKPASRLIRDLGVLALAVMHNGRQGGASAPSQPLRVLDAMSGTGVRSLRYAMECNGTTHVTTNEKQFGEHPLDGNVESLVAQGRCVVRSEGALDLYMRARLDGERFDLVDCDGFGTGMPHTAEAWWAVATGGLLYLCATDSCTTDGHHPHKATTGYAAVAAKHLPSTNEQGLRLLVGAAWREAAARNLHVAPVFSYFHRPSSSFRVMMRLIKPKRPPAAAYQSLAHVARCTRCGQTRSVPSDQLGEYVGAWDGACCGGGGGAAGKATEATDAAGATDAAAPRWQLFGPLWIGPMHDGAFVSSMAAEATARGWDDAASLLHTMVGEAEAEAGGALLYYHLGDVQRHLAAEQLAQPPLADLITLLRAAGYTASHSHIERKAIKTSASLRELTDLVRELPGATSPPREAE